MQYRPSLEQALLMRGDFDVIPVSCEIYADIRTPIEVLKVFKEMSARCFLLESVEGGEHWSRYSFLGFDPVADVRLKDGVMTVRSGAETSFDCPDPREGLRRILRQYRSPRLSYLPPFTGGLVGYFGYDFYKYFAPLHVESDTDDLHLMLFDKLVAFDTFRQRMVFIANVRTDELETDYNRAVSELKNLVDIVVHSRYIPSKPSRLTTPIRAQFDFDAYCRRVEVIKQRIREGDIFQAVLSNCREAGFEGDLLGTYRYLRTTNPSPYMYYMALGDIEIAGASPETLIKKQGDTVMTFPIAGSKPRGRTFDEDSRLEAELTGDEKELAEHDMLVDLGRNDLGKVCRFGSVRVTGYRNVKRFSHIMHLTSTVTGTLADGMDALDAVAATLPAGTLSGAPKLKACEIIADCEGTGRGVYGGGIGYIGFGGDCDVAIAIRTAVLTGGKVYVRSGGGIVADSVPENEYRESVNKAQAVIDALMHCGEEVL